MTLLGSLWMPTFESCRCWPFGLLHNGAICTHSLLCGRPSERHIDDEPPFTVHHGQFMSCRSCGAPNWSSGSGKIWVMPLNCIKFAFNYTVALWNCYVEESMLNIALTISSPNNCVIMCKKRFELEVQLIFVHCFRLLLHPIIVVFWHKYLAIELPKNTMISATGTSSSSSSSTFP